MIHNEFIADENEPSFQIYFENRELLNQPKVTPEELQSKKYFGNTGGVWNQEELKRRTQFFKISLLSEEFFGFKFPDLFEDVLFIGRYEKIENDYERFKILEVGYFDVDSHFHEEKFYVQVGATDLPNFEGNTIYFYKNVFEKWEKQTAFKLGNRKIFNQKEICKIKDQNQKLEKENRQLKNSINDLNSKIEKIRYPKNMDELQKLKKELNQDFLVWNGLNIQDFGINSLNSFTFEQFKKDIFEKIFENENAQKEELAKKLESQLPPEYIEFSKKLEPKDEFETQKEFKERKTKFEIERKSFELTHKKRRDKLIFDNLERVNQISLNKSLDEAFNSYLGSQKITMTYNPEIETFDVQTKFFNFDFNFQIQIPRKIAREFKQQVANFDFNFTQDLVLDSISANFQNQLFYAKDFKKDVFIEITRQRERQQEIASKTVIAEKLMFQDFDFPDEMNWKNACDYCEKLKLLGYTDWRLPESEELKIAYQNKSKFKNIQNAMYWSNTTNKRQSFLSLAVYFANGDGNGSSFNRSHRFFVVCVRDIE